MTETLDTDMRGSSLAASAMFHAAALILVTISLPFLKKDFPAPQPIAVELVTVADISQTTKPAPPAPKPPEKKVEEKKPDKKPPPAPTSKTQDNQTPVEKPPEKIEKPDPKPDDKVIDENAPKVKKVPKKVVKKPPVKKEEPKKDFSSLLKNLVDVKEKPTEQTPPTPDKIAKADDGQALPLGDRMTMNENAAFIKQLEGCWDVPAGAKEAATTTVDIYMVINQDRTLASAEVSDTGRYNSDSFFRVMADSALRAVRNPLCSPFDLPPDKYESWKTITVTFDPSQMF